MLAQVRDATDVDAFAAVEAVAGSRDRWHTGALAAACEDKGPPVVGAPQPVCWDRGQPAYAAAKGAGAGTGRKEDRRIVGHECRRRQLLRLGGRRDRPGLEEGAVAGAVVKVL